MLCTLVTGIEVMAIRIVEFSNGGYKIRKVKVRWLEITKQTNVSFEVFLVGNQGWNIKGQSLDDWYSIPNALSI